MSLLKYSRTWPSILASTMAVVQIRVDPKGRPYSSIIASSHNNNNNHIEQQQQQSPQESESIVIQEEEEKQQQHHAIPIINIVSPYTSIETNDTQLCSSHLLNRLHVPNGGKFCYCSSERRRLMTSNDNNIQHRTRPSFLRSESIKVDNWDYIYTERNQTFR